MAKLIPQIEGLDFLTGVKPSFINIPLIEDKQVNSVSGLDLDYDDGVSEVLFYKLGDISLIGYDTKTILHDDYHILCTIASSYHMNEHMELLLNGYPFEDLYEKVNQRKEYFIVEMKNLKTNELHTYVWLNVNIPSSFVRHHIDKDFDE